MENLWANAWADSAELPLPEPSPTWAAPSVSVLHADHEDDLSTSSWPQGSDSEWGQSDLATDVMWTTTESISVWNPRPSTFDKMVLGRDLDTSSPNPLSDLKDEEDDHVSSLLDPPEVAAATVEVEPSSLVLGSRILQSGESGGWTTIRSRTPLPSPSPPDTSLPPCEDPDTFGSFETGASALDCDAWTPTKLPFPSPPSADVSAWDSAWQQPSPTNSDGKEDAWALARREKEVQDRHVPPELFESILQQLEILSKDLWGEDVPTAEVGNEIDTRITLNDPSLAHRLAPEDLVLSPKAQFHNTFTSKQLTEGLKLTRNFSSTRSSPMAMYMASKGSTSWEASVKARPMVAPDDVTPPGWKIAETTKDTGSPAENETKVTGLFSIFARRAGTSSNTRTSSLGIPIEETSAKKLISLPTSDTTPPTPAQQTSRPGSVLSTRTPSETPTTKPDTPPSSFAPSPVDGSRDRTQPGVASQSLVSRFFGRMSSRSTKRDSRDSLALTPDDLEFLADVPTESSNTNANFGLLDMETLNFIAKPAQLPEVLPLPLPPPPPFWKPTPSPTPQATASNNHDSPSFLDGPDSKPLFSSRPSSGSFAKHTTSLSSSSISYLPSPNSIRSDVVKPSIDNGIHGKTQSQLGTFPPPLVAIVPKVASSSSSDTRSSRNASSTQHPPFKMSTVSIGQSPTGLFPAVNTRPTKQVSVPSNRVDDEDEFSDFLASPPITNSQLSSVATGDFAEFSIVSPTTPSATLIANNDDFGDFANAVSSPNPPPLLKTAGMPVLSPDCKNESLSPISIHSSKGSQKADHSGTLNLLEIASARGRWLSPPSPIPQALSPPPGSVIPKLFNNGHLYSLSETKSMQGQPGGILASVGTASSSPVRTPQQVLLPAPLSTSLLVPLSIHPPSPALPQNGGAPDSTKWIGGLSAQDLSFFEGL